MAGQQYLNTISENATRLGMRLQETFSEHTRDLAIGRGSGAGYLDGGLSDEKSQANIRKQLDSTSDREKLDAMKRLVALISKGRNVSEYFAQVVKNVASQNLEIRKLVYIYLLRYAEHEPDLALLSINTFQKDLADSNPLIRAMALRVLSGIKVPMIGSIVVLAIKKCASDSSPYVRKTAALAVPKCYELDSTHLPALIQILNTILLRDRSALTLGSVVVAFQTICPTRLDLIHPHYRRLCRILVEVDEWGQVELMQLLLRYARTMLVRPQNEPDGAIGRNNTEDKDTEEKHVPEDEMDVDLKLLLDSVEAIFQSRNPAVILAATKVYFYGAPPSYWPKFVAPILRLLTNSKEVERTVLPDLLIITKEAPHLFTPHYTRFLLRSDDLTQVKKDKIRLLLRVLTEDNWNAILREFIDYADDPDDVVVSEAIHSLGICSARIPESIQACLTALITMIKSRCAAVVSNAVMVLKYLVQTQLSPHATGTPSTGTQSPLLIISHLARRIDDIRHAQARACVAWLVGQYGGSEAKSSDIDPEGVAKWAPDVLRKLAQSFGSDESLVKLQTITLAAKLFVLSPTDRTINLLCQYVFSLARYDTNYDVRDRGRMLSSLLVGVGLQIGGPSTEERGGVVLRREQVRLVLFEGKAGTVMEMNGFLDDGKVHVGSLSRVTGRSMMMDENLPDWLERGVESSLRDSEEDTRPTPPVLTAISSAGPIRSQGKGVASPPIILVPTGTSTPNSVDGKTKGQWTDLDSFYAETEDKEESDEGEEEEEEEEESGGESEEEGEDEESSEDDSEESAPDDARVLREVLEEVKTVYRSMNTGTPNSENSLYFDAPIANFHQDDTSMSSIMDLPPPVPGPFQYLGSSAIGETEALEPEKHEHIVERKDMVQHPNGSEGWLPTEGHSADQVRATQAGMASPILTKGFSTEQDNPAPQSLQPVHDDGALQNNVHQTSNPPRRANTTASGLATSKRLSQVTRSGSVRSGAAGSVFGGGAGATGTLATTEEEDVRLSRALEAHSQLSNKQKAKIAAVEAENGKRISKILKNEAKAEKKSLSTAIKELEDLQKVQRGAIKNESKLQANYSKLLSTTKKKEAIYLNAKRDYEKSNMDLETEAQTLDTLRAHARETTEQMQEKAAEVDMLRRTLAVDSREREVKLAQLSGRNLPTRRKSGMWRD